MQIEEIDSGVDGARIDQEMYNDAGYIIRKFSILEKIFTTGGIEEAKKSIGRRHLSIADVKKESDTGGGFAHCENVNGKVVCIIEDSLLEKFPFNTQGKMKILSLFMRYSNLIYEIRNGNGAEAIKLIEEIKQLLR